ncbi:MAG: hypothetical protein WA814_00070 [Candidatus Baltobacteraceae bacterium]
MLRPRSSFPLYYNGRAYPSAIAALRVCCGATGPLPTTTQGLQERVLTAGQTVRYIHLPKRRTDAAVWARLDDARLRFFVHACYCSVLDACWFLDSRQRDPQPVKACPPAEYPLFRG